jgi:hypothetical protein
MNLISHLRQLLEVFMLICLSHSHKQGTDRSDAGGVTAPDGAPLNT